MRRWLTTGVVMAVTLFVWAMVAVPVFAGSGVTAGARSAAGGGTARSIPDESAQSAPSSFQEVTASFTATPTTGGLGDALEASRTTFSTSEEIEFNGVLFESGLAETSANLQLYLFDQAGKLVTATFFVNGILAPDDRTGFFIQLSPGSVPAGRLKWVMAIFDAFGNLFVTPFQALNVQ
jgi:hypothetical protein